MCFIFETVARVRKEKGHGDHVHVAKGDSVVFLGLLFRVAELVLVFKGNAVKPEGVWGITDADVNYGGDFPELEHDAHSLREEDHPTGVVVVVKEIEEDDALHENVC